ARLLPKRRRGIPVKIRPFTHGFRRLPNYRLPLYPAKSLLFAPGIVVEARNRSALIACVEAGKSGIRIIRIILNYVPAGQSARPQPIPVPRLTAASSVRG